MYYFTTQNVPKTNYVERVQKSKGDVKNDEKIDIIALLTKYKILTSSHRSLGYIAPKDANKQNESQYIYVHVPEKIEENRTKFNSTLEKVIWCVFHI